MKKIVYLLMALGLTFAACNPMDDIYEDIDSQENPVVGNVEYTLTADDYEELELSYDSFNSEDEAKQLIPGLLADLYPFMGKGSSILAGYELYVGNAEGVSDYSGADIYELSNSDYASTGSDAFGFYPDVNPNDLMGDVLAANVTGAEGDILLAKYKQYTEVPEVGLANIVEYNFAGSLEGWTITDLVGEQGWTSESGYVQGNGYSGGQIANEDWLVSPEIDLTNESDLKFQITHELDYAGDTSLLKILVSTDYTDDVTTATWDEITLSTAVTGDMAPSEDYDFSAYDGETIHVAFKYESTDSDAGRWRIESLAIKTLGVSGETANKGTHFMYAGGAWEVVDGVYYLSSSDFDSMGEGSGQPGQYNNFGSSVPPNNYLPTFLDIKYPFAQEDDQIIAIYDYYSSSSGAQIRGNLYTVVDGMWVGHESTISTTLQFGHDGTVWVPDNTIRYTLTGDDYALVASTLLTADGFASAAGNLDSYGNFNRTGGATSWDDEMMITAMGIVAASIDPNAAVGQKYLMTCDIYNGSGGTEDFYIIKDDSGEWVVFE
ncbi:choice-of-anchor J domain-containing protein [Urechidicola croceus]|uniref:Uncharacterized protein n=1 Tax=Urechidicola croceus TaxID=1850246 RepID=A0A1D8P9T2_9FLAO|nr:choice-of-anchor J domain-containing protein [Urechidicola croceus]AOW21362.1 hypothetical protein LPB138_12030 [Urechidicola croceus]